MGIIQKISAFLRGAEVVAGTLELQNEAEGIVADSVPAQASASVPLVAPRPSVPTASPKLAAPVISDPPEGMTAAKAAGVKKVVLDEAGLSILDLRELPSGRFRIVGSSFWVTDSGRYKHGGSDYLLVREPKNKWDENAVAVYGKGRKVGHLSEAKAAALTPILDLLTFDAYRVGGAPPASDSIRMWVDVPSIAALRTFVRNWHQKADS